MNRITVCLILSSVLVFSAFLIVETSITIEEGYEHPEKNSKRIPFCPPKGQKSKRSSSSVEDNSNINQSILLVSTLDGKIQALDPEDSGRMLWSVATEPGDMLSSTISQMELTSNARWVKLIPSLGGGLYKFDGETVQAVPLDAETLLKSSFKFADNTVINGGKESRTYGIEASTGKVRYVCSINGCETVDGLGVASVDDSIEDVIVVQRETQVVRAVEPRTGLEKWNFSVSQHNINYHVGLEELCDDEDDEEFDGGEDEIVNDPEYPVLDDGGDLNQLKAVVSDGIICSVDRKFPSNIQWSHKFDSPIVHAWRIYKGKVYKVDLFSDSHLPNFETSKNKFDQLDQHLVPPPLPPPTSPPLLYIGSHKQQLYIQESDRMKALDKQTVVGVDETVGSSKHPPRVTWRPYLISSASRTPVINHGAKRDVEKEDGLPLLTYADEKLAESTALSVISGAADYPYDSGLYLYSEEGASDLSYDPILDYDQDLNNDTDSKSANNSTEETLAEDDSFGDESSETIQIVFVSLWYWWKEVVLISMMTAVMMNVIITRPMINAMRDGFRRKLEQILNTRIREVVYVAEEVPVPVSIPSLNQQISQPESLKSSASTEKSGLTEIGWRSTESVSEFSSRYLDDFDPVRCLGKGGFGVVFEAKNKIDDIHYAVKRIQLPKSEDSRKKVMREVKFLAKLDHKNIVRYFNTWIESPPSGWQEKQDSWWKENGEMLPSVSGVDLQSYDDKYLDEDEDSELEETTGDKTNWKMEQSCSSLGGIVFADENAGESSSRWKETYSRRKYRKSQSRRVGDSNKKEDSFSIVFQDSSKSGKEEEGELDPVQEEEEEYSESGRGFFKKERRSGDLDDDETKDSRFSEDESKSCEDALRWEEAKSRGQSRRKRKPRKSSSSLGSLSDSTSSSERPIYLYIVMQLCKKDSLRDWLRDNNTAELRCRKTSLDVFREICNGVGYVHAQGLIHRDLKPSNIFFSADGGIKIGDFGLVTGRHDTSLNETLTTENINEINATDQAALNFDQQHTDQVGTELYMSPEQARQRSIRGFGYDHKVDVYALGVILFELLVPFGTQMERVRTLADLRRLKFPKDFESRPEDVSLVKSMISYDPLKRPEAVEILESESYKNMVSNCQ